MKKVKKCPQCGNSKMFFLPGECACGYSTKEKTVRTETRKIKGLKVFKRRSEKKMKKHTPGPWSHGFVEGGWGVTPRIKVQNRCLLFVLESDGNILPSKEDARLIAAAPELLARLEETLMYLTQSNLGPVCRELAESIRVTIRKVGSSG